MFKSYDRNGQGLLEQTIFKKTLVEYFPVLSNAEITVLMEMAENISAIEGKKGNIYNRKSDEITKNISYFHFLMQIEKYYALQATTEQNK